MKDLKVFETGNGGSIELKGRDLVIVEGIHNMIYLALFGGNYVSTPSRRVDTEQAFDFWGNVFLKPDKSLQFNSTTEKTLNEVQLNSEGRSLIESAVKYDLNFLQSYGSVSINVDITGPNKVTISIELLEPDNAEAKRFQFIWNGTRQDFLNESMVQPMISNSYTPTPNAEPVTIRINGDFLKSVNSGGELDIELIDTNSSQVGTIINDNTVQVPASINLSGILFDWPKYKQYTSYRTGDEGYRLQNSLLMPENISNPEFIPELDYSIGANYWFQLKEPLKVGANSNVQRFVDVDGLQVWGATGNKDKIIIDKLTGLGIIRDWRNIITGLANKNWNDSIDIALSFSIVVDGITYSDWYLPTLSECEAIWGSYIDRSATYFKDPITLANIIYITGWQSTWTSTTIPASTTRAYVWEAPTQFYRINGGYDKTTTGFAASFMIFDARNLISKP